MQDYSRVSLSFLSHCWRVVHFEIFCGVCGWGGGSNVGSGRPWDVVRTPAAIHASVRNHRCILAPPASVSWPRCVVCGVWCVCVSCCEIGSFLSKVERECVISTTCFSECVLYGAVGGCQERRMMRMCMNWLSRAIPGDCTGRGEGRGEG